MKLQQVWIENLTNQDIAIAELGGRKLLAHESLNLTARVEGESYYGDALSALRALHELTTTSLYQALHNTPPAIGVKVCLLPSEGE